MNARMGSVYAGLAVCIAAVAWCGDQRAINRLGLVKVRDFFGNPLEDAELRAHPSDSAATKHSVVVTNMHGRANLTLLSERPHDLEVTCPGYVTRSLASVTCPIAVTPARRKP